MIKAKKRFSNAFKIGVIATVFCSTLAIMFFCCFKKSSANLEKKIIPIVMSIDKNYLYPTIVTITSMLENINENTFYKIHLMVAHDVVDEDKKKILSLNEKYKNFDINFIDMADKFEGIYSGNVGSSAVYYRLKMQTLLSEDKCLFLDTDILVLKDLSEFFDINLSDKYYYAGVADGFSYENHIQERIFDVVDNFRTANKYIYNGGIVANLKKLREDNIEKIFDKMVEENRVKKFMILPNKI